MANLYSGAGGGAGAVAVARGNMDGPQGEHDVMDASRYSTKEVLGRLLLYVRPHLMLLVFSTLASAVAAVLQLFVPIIVGKGIDALVGAGALVASELAPIVFRLAIVVAAASATQWIASVCTNRLSLGIVRDLREDALGSFECMPFSFLDAHAHGDLLSRVVNDADAVGDGLLQGFTQIFSGIVTIVATLVFMFSLSVPVGLVVVLLTPLSMLVASLIARRSSSSFAEAQGLTGELSAYVEEMVSNQALVCAFGREEACMEEFGGTNHSLNVAGERAQFVSSLSNPATRLVNNTTYAVVAAVGCVCVITGVPSPLTIGGVQCFLSYANQYMKPFNDISGVVSQLQAAMASARRLLALMDVPAEEDVAFAELPMPTQGDITFDHVSFSYEPGHPTLRDVSFHARPGMRFALVGSTGCGKTTLINLLMRFYDVDEGTIFVDGCNTASLARANLRSAFGMVLQESWLNDATIAQNIAYGRPDATMDEIVAAAKQAHAHKFIVQLPRGYDTHVGGEASALSHGQMQLLCIARVMLADPAILLLDEATSSIDTRTELQVQDAFDRMMAGRTSLVVAHRLSTIRKADCILVMDAGRIVERGTHDELLARDGAYARLYRSQWANQD